MKPLFVLGIFVALLFLIGCTENTIQTSFSPQEKSLSILKAEKEAKVLAPVDGTIDTDLDNTKIVSTLFKQLFTPASHKNITIIDLTRLALFSKTVPRSSIIERTFLGINDSRATFKDPKIINEAKSIEIINATDIAGLGNKLAVFISNMGGNVILVKTEEPKQNSKIIYYGEKTYTLTRINKFLKYEVTPSTKREVADVIIVIGKDGLKELDF